MAALALLLAVLPLLLASCQDLGYHPVFTLSLHEFSDLEGSRLTMWVMDTQRKHRRKVMKYGFLTSRDIEEIQVTGPAENGKYGLLLKVSRWSFNDVGVTAVSNPGVLYAVVMDGSYIGGAHFIKTDRQAGVFEVEPIFTEYIASNIASHAQKNHDYYGR